MRVTIGDGRVIEVAGGITKLPPGPMPETLASEVYRPFVVDTKTRGNEPSAHPAAPIPASLWAGRKERRKVDVAMLRLMY